jgi:hypothetical protein
MTAVGVAILTISLMIAALQIAMSLRFAREFNRPELQLLPDNACPAAMALLCLRGTDPFLPNTLRKLFQQDYPNYRIRVVIDSATDPARSLVEQAIAETGAGHVEVLVLDHRDRHCGAKMSSLLLGTDRLPEDCRYVATFDGDAVLHPSCLRELVSALVARQAQVASGVRWYAPDRPTFGAIARMEWNLGCNTVMHAMRLSWGGCLAVSRDIITDPELRRLYAGAFAEDMLLASFVKRHGGSVVHVPQATIINREDISLRGTFAFLTRQMLAVRLHHHQWRQIVGYGIVMMSLAGVICPLGLLYAPLRPWCLAGLIALIIALGSLMYVGSQVRRFMAQRGGPLIEMKPKTIVMMLVTGPLTTFITLLANLRAWAALPITWRGLRYRFGRDPIVTLVSEAPLKE